MMIQNDFLGIKMIELQGMDMTQEEIIKSICHVARDYGSPIYFSENQRQNISRNIKKLKLEEQIRIDHLINYINNHSELIEKWIGYCEDKRGGVPVYFTRKKEEFIFGIFDERINKSRPVLILKTPELPCVMFIIFELGLEENFFPV